MAKFRFKTESRYNPSKRLRTLICVGDRVVRFEGELIGEALSSPDPAHPTFSGLTEHWDEIRIYRTATGFVAERAWGVVRPVRRVLRDALETDSEAGVLDYLGMDPLALEALGQAGIRPARRVRRRAHQFAEQTPHASSPLPLPGQYAPGATRRFLGALIATAHRELSDPETAPDEDIRSYLLYLRPSDRWMAVKGEGGWILTRRAADREALQRFFKDEPLRDELMGRARAVLGDSAVLDRSR